MKTRIEKTFTGFTLISLLSLCVSNAEEPDNQVEKAESLNRGIRSLGIVIHNGGDKGVTLMKHIAEAFPGLKELRIDYSPYGFVPESVIDNIVKLDSLSSLSFNGDLIFTSEQLSRIAKKPKLRKLSFACP